MLQKSLAERGMQFLMKAQTQELCGQRRGPRGQREIQGWRRGAPADLVVMAVGIRPNTALARKCACMSTAASW